MPFSRNFPPYGAMGLLCLATALFLFTGCPDPGGSGGNGNPDCPKELDILPLLKEAQNNSFRISPVPVADTLYVTYQNSGGGLTMLVIVDTAEERPTPKERLLTICDPRATERVLSDTVNTALKPRLLRCDQELRVENNGKIQKTMSLKSLCEYCIHYRTLANGMAEIQVFTTEECAGGKAMIPS
ncbi:MAG: hypothetical protein AAF570_26050 [Bacteroidota bacterium]